MTLTMHTPDIDQLTARIGSHYELIMLATKRVGQLREGAKPMVKINSSNLLDVALAEIAAGKIKAQRIPPSPEGEEIKPQGNVQDPKGEAL